MIIVGGAVPEEFFNWCQTQDGMTLGELLMIWQIVQINDNVATERWLEMDEKMRWLVVWHKVQDKEHEQEAKVN
jgi:hypothetical protein